MSHGRILLRFRECIRCRDYVLTLHAEEEMEEDSLTVFDLEHVVLTGEIVERQRELVSGQWKYRIRGATIALDEAEVVVRLSPTAKLICITVYRL